MNDLSLVVAASTDDGPARTFTLTGSALAPFVPGSHLLIDCGGKADAYSLLDDGVAPDAYRISVLGHADGDGSTWLRARRVGDVLSAAPPRSAFAPVADARHHLLIAAGIGITPLMSHAHAAARWGRSFTLLYRHSTGAHLEELTAVCGGRLESLPTREAYEARLALALVTQPVGTHLYVCGPPSFTAGVLEAALAAGWPAVRLHAERFTTDALDPGRPFSVRVGDQTYDVPAGISLLEVLERQGHALPYRCRQGVCGECLVSVKAGRPEHRDLYLSAAERSAGDCVLPCVSRSLDDLLELTP